MRRVLTAPTLVGYRCGGGSVDLVRRIQFGIFVFRTVLTLRNWLAFTLRKSTKPALNLDYLDRGTTNQSFH